MQPLLKHGAVHPQITHFLACWRNASPTISIRTSGSTGVPKTIAVAKEAMRCSARKTLQFFNLKAGDTALLCLSVDYIAGKMMIVRAIEGDLQLHAVTPCAMPLQYCSLPRIDFVAMTPMQVAEELKAGTSLDRIGTLLIGGSALNRELAEALQQTSCKVYESYGMSETVSHIALRRINGKEKQTGFLPMSGVQVQLDSRGCLVIDCPDILSEPLATNDRAEILSSGEFRILGRVDNVINSGGIKIQPEELEKIIEPYLPCPFVVSFLPDERLGQKPVLATEADIRPETLAELNRHLPKYHRLHEVFHVRALSRTENGKIDRPAIVLTIQALAQ